MEVNEGRRFVFGSEFFLWEVVKRSEWGVCGGGGMYYGWKYGVDE